MAEQPSLIKAIQYLRGYMSALLELPLTPRPGDPGNAAGLAGINTIQPLNQNSSVSVRYGDFTEYQALHEPKQSAAANINGVLQATKTISGPRVSWKVFVDVRHGQDEIGHLTALSVLMKFHPPRSRVVLNANANLPEFDDFEWDVLELDNDGSTPSAFERELICDTIAPQTMGDVYRTTLTGRLIFELIEAGSSVTAPVLDRINVNVRQGEDDPLDRLKDPNIETFLIN